MIQPQTPVTPWLINSALGNHFSSFYPHFPYLENRNHVSHGNKHILKCLILHKGRIISSWGPWGHCTTSRLSKMPTNSSFSALNFNLDFSEIQINFLNNLVKKANGRLSNGRPSCWGQGLKQKTVQSRSWETRLSGKRSRIQSPALTRISLWSWASYRISVKQGVNCTSFIWLLWGFNKLMHIMSLQQLLADRRQILG